MSRPKPPGAGATGDLFARAAERAAAERVRAEPPAAERPDPERSDAERAAAGREAEPSRPAAAERERAAVEKALPRPYTVRELTRALKSAIEPRFRDVWVAGEVANLRRQASGHVYFSLKDDDAVIGAVMWASQARRLAFAPGEGLEVLARGFVEIYPPHGKYQLVVQELEPRGAGAQALQLQQLKERLQAEGLLDPARKRPLPFLPARVGVATSPTGAALRDLLRVLHARFPGAPVLIAPCRVQGEGAAATVISAVRALCRAGVDVVVVTRGGGSQEDLWAFNDERLARAIAACPVPVVSAVGHEVDVTVADLVADVRAATPTHAAQLVVPVRDELVERVAALRARLARAQAGAVEGRRRTLRALRAELADPKHLLSRERHRLDDLAHRAEAAVRGPRRRERAALDALRGRLTRLEPRARVRALRARMESATRRLGGWQAATFRREAMRLERLGARLEPANVAKLLARGFALALRDGHLLLRSADAQVGDGVRVALAEGWLDARITGRDAGDDPLPGRSGPAGEPERPGHGGEAVDPPLRRR
ncbi:exodeoxyribonuclease VII, large subunit [Anaeromyxobacter dehalogenans 2CP-1]|uniref:Exodeoxyribonuclease 7 large subunit n=1 Tax=Anaeromyxobacter dehalogenans (strain ATCC BAA-258 / DSM 21875 / 2CP-1) TaxID=455488 RepID=B8JFX7_ANAD2|nr:exodeoxyribonuclease VII large subunit [Anaeromyxobacter dehalogenans]ACL64565.1 exodeoxyribonuclease VII, large subunit [Anaeromyxobacter dehalogenans 2CP-1]